MNKQENMKKKRYYPTCCNLSHLCSLLCSTKKFRGFRCCYYMPPYIWYISFVRLLCSLVQVTPSHKQKQKDFTEKKQNNDEQNKSVNKSSAKGRSPPHDHTCSTNQRDSESDTESDTDSVANEKKEEEKETHVSLVPSTVINLLYHGIIVYLSYLQWKTLTTYSTYVHVFMLFVFCLQFMYDTEQWSKSST